MAERDRYEHRNQVRDFSNEANEAYEGYPKALRKDLNEAVYTFDELGLWNGGFMIKDADLAIRIWAMVETIRRTGNFPNELKM